MAEGSRYHMPSAGWLTSNIPATSSKISSQYFKFISRSTSLFEDLQIKTFDLRSSFSRCWKASADFRQMIKQSAALPTASSYYDIFFSQIDTVLTMFCRQKRRPKTKESLRSHLQVHHYQVYRQVHPQVHQPVHPTAAVRTQFACAGAFAITNPFGTEDSDFRAGNRFRPGLWFKCLERIHKEGGADC